MHLISGVAKKAVETGVGVVLPVAFKAYEKAVESPVGPLMNKALDASGKLAAPLLGLLGLNGHETAPPREGLEERGTTAEPRQVRHEDVAAERAVELAPRNAPITENMPLPTYEHMTMPAILDALNGLTVNELRLVRGFEAEHGDRLPIIERIDELLESVDASL